MFWQKTIRNLKAENERLKAELANQKHTHDSVMERIQRTGEVRVVNANARMIISDILKRAKRERRMVEMGKFVEYCLVSYNELKTIASEKVC